MNIFANYIARKVDPYFYEFLREGFLNYRAEFTETTFKEVVSQWTKKYERR